MLLSELFGDRFASTTLVGADNQKSDFGKIFLSNSYVCFYFHQENVIAPLSSSADLDQSRRQQQQPRSCQLFFEQAKILRENLRDSSGGGSNAKKAKPTSGQDDRSCLAFVFVPIAHDIDGDDKSDEIIDCAVGRDLRDDFVWILSSKEKQTKVLLLRTYKIRSTPAFVIVDARTKRTIAIDGRRALQADPLGRRFPWHLPEPADVFRGHVISQKNFDGNSNGELIDVGELRGAARCLLFAAHWCPPCRSFVKQLTQIYTQLKESNSSSSSPVQFEVIFCSMDRCEDSFRQFYSEMPWLTFPYNDPRCIAAARLYNVQEIPTLLILDSDNQLITRHGKCELAMDTLAKEFPWYPKVVLELNSHTANRLREDMSFLLFTEGQSEDLVFAQTSLLPVAEEFCVRSNPDLQDLLFFYCGDDPVCDQVWDNLGLADASLPLICIVDPFTDNLYVCDDPNVSEVIIRKFIEKFYSGDLEPTKRLASPPITVGNRGNFLLNSPQQPNASFIGNDSSIGSKSQGDQDQYLSVDQGLGSKRLCVNVGAMDTTNAPQRYCL